MQQKRSKGGRPLGSMGPDGFLELALGDLADGAEHMAAVVHLADAIKRRAAKAHAHSARGYRRVAKVTGAGVVAYSGAERRRAERRGGSDGPIEFPVAA